MSERGVFAVDRGIFTDPDFAKEPFTEREAFMWIVSEAAWKPHGKRADGKVVELKRGQLCHSVRFMAEAWQWSKSRVDRFLGRLQNRDIISRDVGTRTPVITVCNYDAFQRVSLPDRDNSGTTSGTRPGQQRDKLEDRETTEDSSSSLRSEDIPARKKATPRSELSLCLDAQRTQAVIEHRTRIGKPLTAHAAHLLAGKFARCPDPNAAADAMVSNGWQGFEPEWMERRTAHRGQPPPSGTGNAMVDRLDELMNGMGQRNADERRTIEGSNEHGAYDRTPQALLGPAASQGRR